MKKLFEYLQEVDKEYSWRLKFAKPVSDDDMAKIESLLARYDVKKVSEAKKTIIQGRAMDFADLGPTEVYMVDAVCGLPATREAIREVLAKGLGIPMNLIVVRTEDEPLETDRAEKEVSKEPLLTSDYEKTEQAKVYGSEYNQKLVDDNKGTFTYEVAGKEKTTKSSPVYDEGKSPSPLTKVKSMGKHPKKI